MALGFSGTMVTIDAVNWLIAMLHPSCDVGPRINDSNLTY